MQFSLKGESFSLVYIVAVCSVCEELKLNLCNLIALTAATFFFLHRRQREGRKFSVFFCVIKLIKRIIKTVREREMKEKLVLKVAQENRSKKRRNLLSHLICEMNII